MESSPSSSPGSQQPSTITIPNGAPKFGTLVPNRVFVGGISSTTTEAELHQLFSAFGNVKQTKIIQDRAGVSKGYGFVTFETEEEARRLQVEADNIMLKERKLNIAPAIKKQQTYCGRSYEMGQPVLNGGYYYSPSGTPYTYQNGVAMFTAESGQQALSLLQQLPGKGAHSGHTTPSHFPLIYGPGGHAAAAMFLPGGHSAAQAAAVASSLQNQQQLQIQTAAATAAHMNSLATAAAAQTQSPSREAGGGSRDSAAQNSTTQGWRWTALGAQAAGSTAATGQAPGSANCGAQQAVAAQAAALAHSSVASQLAAQSTGANQHLGQTVNYAQGGSGYLPLETFHYIPSVFSTAGLSHHPGFVIPDRQTNY